MSFDKPTRNKLASMVGDCRRLLTEDIRHQLQAFYGLQPDGSALAVSNLTHLDERGRNVAGALRLWQEHLGSTEPGTEAQRRKATFERLAHETAFTVLNRLAALRMCEQRGHVIECVRRGMESDGFVLYERFSQGVLGGRGETYRVFLERMFGELAVDLGALFDLDAPQSLVFPRERCLEEVLSLLNREDLSRLWAQDETIGWIYQYFNSKEEREAMRKFAAPRNGRELAVRNQFFTPRYVVEFLVDNTLGRLWYEMRQGHTALKETCQYLVRRPTEIFLHERQELPSSADAQQGLSQDELLKQPVYLPYRAKRDPRTIKILDPAVGSGHFLLYAFDLLEIIYQEAWEHEEQQIFEVTGKTLREEYGDLNALKTAIPELILRHNLHGIDIDLRACQIAALALWLRAQRGYQDLGLKGLRPKINRSNIVCAEPMPGEQELLNQFLAGLQPKVIGQLVQAMFEKMKLAGEAGSLLKIEEEIADAVADAKQKWLAGPKPEQGLLFADLARPQQQKLAFDFSGITNEAFWEKAEERIYTELQSYAEKAENGRGYQRRLFADDAERGFAFVDLCRKRYDIVVMNPPFGAASAAWKPTFEKAYPRTKNDMYAAFVERGLAILDPNGMVGAITSRTGFFLTSFQKWREDILVREAPPIIFADLGHGVLDSAMVETAAYCLRRFSYGDSTFMRLLTDEDKSGSLRECVDAIRDNRILPAVFRIDPKAFSQVPQTPFAYWTTANQLSAFARFKGLEDSGFQVRKGLDTNDNFRFFRLSWEVPATRDSYVPLAKGGAYSKYYSDVHLVIDWRESGELLKESIRTAGDHPSRNVRSEDKYFLPGLTWSQRTTKGLSVRLLSKGNIFTTKGPAITGNPEKLTTLLALMNSSVFDSLISLLLAAADSAARSYDIGVIQRTPVPTLEHPDCFRLSECALACIDLKRKQDETNELSHTFLLPASISSKNTTLTKGIAEWQKHAKETDGQLSLIQDEIDAIALRLYGIPNWEQSTVSEDPRQAGVGDTEIGDENEQVDFEEVAGNTSLVSDLINYFLGAAFGRWDIRFATGETPAPALSDPFAPLPVCPPGMLQNKCGLPLTNNDVQHLGQWDYPVEISWDGIFVDDPDSVNDIVRRLREVFNIIWKERAEVVEQEACEILEVKDTRDYFRKPALFFADHLNRYSKSRRQAPIYWPLSTASGSYTLWVYYHRLNEDSLYTALNKFVKPKIYDTEKQLRRIESELPNATGREASSLRTAFEDTGVFLDELREFRDELARVADLPYKPNLNDGVLITASPLWKLFRLPKWRKDLQEGWKKLEAGDYDWAHLAYSIWPDRVRDVCKSDRSIAIAHNLELLCEIAAKPAKKKRSKKIAPQEIVEETVPGDEE